MKRFLITGAAGSLGSVLMSQLRGLSEITALGMVRQLADVGDDLVFCDLKDQTRLVKLIQDFHPSCIIHLAATFSNEMEKCMELNVMSSISILNNIEKFNPSCRIVLIGSAAEYGCVKPEHNPISESHQLQPISPYGYSKACQSHLIGLYSARGLDVVGARVFNLLGPNMSSHLFVGRVQSQIDEILKGTRTTLEIGPLEAFRDYISVSDASNWLLRIAYYGLSGHTYNVASGVPVQMRVLLEGMLQESRLNMNCVKEDRTFSNRAGYDVPIIFADMTKSNNLLSL